MNVTTLLERSRSENGLLALVASMARGPRRDGLFAVWLLVRVIRDFQLDPPFPERLQRRRVTALEARLTSLTMPSPLRRAITSALSELRGPAAANPGMLLAQLVAPVRESASAEAADLLAELARSAREPRSWARK